MFSQVEGKMKSVSNTKRTAQRDWSRRAVLAAGAAMCASPAMPAVVSLTKPHRPTRRLWMKSIYTGEIIDTVYRRDGLYIPSKLNDINWFMRDWRTNEYIRMDIAAIDLWSALHRNFGLDQPMELISGYRSPQTNTLLRARSSGVSKNSLHIHGRAADLRLPGKITAEIARAAISIGAGGVGAYPKLNFVHVDNGPLRRWER